MKPKISVIIPVYKVEPYLRQCLDSVVNQTYRNLEIILIDDGSPDNCGIICDEYAERDQRIHVIHKANGGLCAARNDGIERATGEWITFVDSDDWCELDYYETLIEELGNQTPDIFCSGGKIFEYSYEQKISQCITSAFRYTEKVDLEKLMCGIIAPGSQTNRSLGSPWDKLYHAEFIRKRQQMFDISCKAWEDWLFNFQAFNQAKIISGCSYVGYHYRQISNSITKGYNSQKPRINHDFITKLYHYAQQEKLSQNIFDAIEAAALYMMINSLSCCYFHPAHQEKTSELSKEIKEMKAWPNFHKAIWSHCNKYLTRKRVAFKYVFRLPWLWPLKLLFFANQMRAQGGNKRGEGKESAT